MLRSALAARPEANRLYYLLARALRAQGREAEAREALTLRGTAGLLPADPILASLDELEAGDTRALLLGRRAFDAGGYEAARDAFAEALERNPESIAARVNLATTLGVLGRDDEARALYEEVLDREPDNRAALFNLAALDEAAAPERAIRRYRRLAELEPSDPEVRFRLGLLLAQTGRLEPALESLERARSEPAFHSRSALLSVRLLVADGQEARAAAVLEEARGIAPRDPELVAMQISLWTTANDPAVRDGEAALALARQRYEVMGDSESARLLAQAYAEVGQCDAARNWLRTASELAPTRAVSDRLTAASESTGDNCRYPFTDPSASPGNNRN